MRLLLIPALLIFASLSLAYSLKNRKVPAKDKLHRETDMLSN